MPSLNTTYLRSMRSIDWTTCGPCPTIAVIERASTSGFTNARCFELGSPTNSGVWSIPQWTLTITASAPFFRARRAAAMIGLGLSARSTDHGWGSGMPLVSVV